MRERCAFDEQSFRKERVHYKVFMDPSDFLIHLNPNTEDQILSWHNFYIFTTFYSQFQVTIEDIHRTKNMKWNDSSCGIRVVIFIFCISQCPSLWIHHFYNKICKRRQFKVRPYTGFYKIILRQTCRKKTFNWDQDAGCEALGPGADWKTKPSEVFPGSMVLGDREQTEAPSQAPWAQTKACHKRELRALLKSVLPSIWGREVRPSDTTMTKGCGHGLTDQSSHGRQSQTNPHSVSHRPEERTGNVCVCVRH